MPPISSTTISLAARISSKSPSFELRTPATSGPPPGDLLDHVGPLLEQRAERPADGPLPEDPDVHRLGHHSSLLSRSSQVSRRTTTLASPSRQKITGGLGTPL